MEEQVKKGPLTVASALGALAGAAALTIGLYFVVGFPANVPVAVGASVLLAELFETAGRGEGTSPVRFASTVFHAVLATFASWLGVETVRLIGWIS